MPLHPQAEAIARAFAERMATASGAAPTIEERRAVVDASPRVPGPDMARVENRTVEGPNGDVPVRVLVPHGARPLPVVMYFHGGGWVIGTVDSSEAMARSIAEASGCIVVSVEYRLSPEHKFPMGLEDCYAATRWAAEEASSFGGDGSRLAVSGDSSGGNLAAAVCLVARDRGAPAIAYQALIYPVLDRNFETRSYEDNANGYLLTRRMMVSNWRDYLDREETAANPYAAPVQSKDVSGLPPAYVLTAEYDPLRDEGEAYAGMLERAGVPTRYVCYAGMVHGFFGFTGQIDMAREAVADVGAAVRAALAR